MFCYPMLFAMLWTFKIFLDFLNVYFENARCFYWCMVQYCYRILNTMHCNVYAQLSRVCKFSDIVKWNTISLYWLLFCIFILFHSLFCWQFVGIETSDALILKGLSESGCIYVSDFGLYTDGDGNFNPSVEMPLLASRYQFVDVIGAGQSSIILRAKVIIYLAQSLSLLFLLLDGFYNCKIWSSGSPLVVCVPLGTCQLLPRGTWWKQELEKKL